MASNKHLKLFKWKTCSTSASSKSEAIINIMTLVTQGYLNYCEYQEACNKIFYYKDMDEYMNFDCYCGIDFKELTGKTIAEWKKIKDSNPPKITNEDIALMNQILLFTEPIVSDIR